MLRLTETEYVDEDFAEVDLTGQELAGITFTRCDFSEAALVDVHTRRVTFTDCRFRGTELYDSAHRSSAFVSCTFERAALHGMSLVGCRLTPLRAPGRIAPRARTT